MWVRGLNTTMPIYVTRPHGAKKETASYEFSLWMTMLAILLIWLSIIVWSLVGFVVAVRVVF